MSVLLICDAPGCFNTTPAVSRTNRVSKPDGWWLQCLDDGRIVCACSDQHLNLALKARPA